MIQHIIRLLILSLCFLLPANSYGMVAKFGKARKIPTQAVKRQETLTGKKSIEGSAETSTIAKKGNISYQTPTITGTKKGKLPIKFEGEKRSAISQEYFTETPETPIKSAEQIATMPKKTPHISPDILNNFAERIRNGLDDNNVSSQTFSALIKEIQSNGLQIFFIDPSAQDCIDLIQAWQNLAEFDQAMPVFYYDDGSAMFFGQSDGSEKPKIFHSLGWTSKYTNSTIKALTNKITCSDKSASEGIQLLHTGLTNEANEIFTSNLDFFEQIIEKAESLGAKGDILRESQDFLNTYKGSKNVDIETAKRRFDSLIDKANELFRSDLNHYTKIVEQAESLGAIKEDIEKRKKILNDIKPKNKFSINQINKIQDIFLKTEQWNKDQIKLKEAEAKQLAEKAEAEKVETIKEEKPTPEQLKAIADAAELKSKNELEKIEVDKKEAARIEAEKEAKLKAEKEAEERKIADAAEKAEAQRLAEEAEAKRLAEKKEEERKIVTDAEKEFEEAAERALETQAKEEAEQEVETELKQQITDLETQATESEHKIEALEKQEQQLIDQQKQLELTLQTKKKELKQAGVKEEAEGATKIERLEQDLKQIEQKKENATKLKEEQQTKLEKLEQEKEQKLQAQAEAEVKKEIELEKLEKQKAELQRLELELQQIKQEELATEQAKAKRLAEEAEAKRLAEKKAAEKAEAEKKAKEPKEGEGELKEKIEKEKKEEIPQAPGTKDNLEPIKKQKLPIEKQKPLSHHEVPVIPIKLIERPSRRLIPAKKQIQEGEPIQLEAPTIEPTKEEKPIKPTEKKPIEAVEPEPTTKLIQPAQVSEGIALQQGHITPTKLSTLERSPLPTSKPGKIARSERFVPKEYPTTPRVTKMPTYTPSPVSFHPVEETSKEPIFTKPSIITKFTNFIAASLERARKQALVLWERTLKPWMPEWFKKYLERRSAARQKAGQPPSEKQKQEIEAPKEEEVATPIPPEKETKKEAINPILGAIRDFVNYVSSLFGF